MSAAPTRPAGPPPAFDRARIDARWDALCDRGNLTRRQLLIWGGDRVAAGAPVFAEGVLLHIQGALDVRRFQAAVQAVLDESDALRSVVENVEGRPVQRIRASILTTVEVVDLAANADPSRALETLAHDRVARVAGIDTRFDTILVRLGPTHWVWVLTQHQLVSDAWSFRLVYERVAAHYEADAGSRTLEAEAPPSFAEYIAHERGLRASARAGAAREYWRGRYGEESTQHALPRLADPRQATAIGREIRRLDRATAARIAALAARAGSHDVGVFALVASLLAAHLYRSAGSRLVVFDVPFANRSSERFKRTIGSFMSVCPVRIAIDGGDTFDRLFERLLAATWEASQHQWYADRVGRADQPYEVLVNIYRHEIAGRTFASMPLRIEWPSPTHRFGGVTVAIADFGATGEPALAIDCNLEAFGPDARADLVRDVGRLLEQCLTNPTGRIDAPPSASSSVQTGALTPPVWTRFARQAASTPHAIAVQDDDTAITYAELRARAESVADLLSARGVARGAIVAVWGARGVHVIAAMLGVFRNGAVYLPIDPRWPATRIRDVMRQSGARVVLTPEAGTPVGIPSLDDEDAWEVVTTVAVASMPALRADSDRASDAPADLAYVVYTSGSTGIPKGALVDHAALANHLDAKIALLALGRDDRVAQTAAVSFDVSIWQCLAVLLAGGRVVVVADDAVRDPARLLGVLAGSGVTVLEVVPAMIDPLLETSSAPDLAPAGASMTLRWLVVTGDALAPELCRRWLRRYPTVPLVNAYGPTECADDVAHQVIQTPPAAGAVRVPIGRPISNVGFEIVDATLQPVPMGEVGEIVVSGIAVGRGYLNDPERTAAAFVSAPVGSRRYRTGDRGRDLGDGTFECLGRLDDQVKIRGVRVEPGEVAAVLVQHADVRDAAVVAEPAPGGGVRLVAYVVLAGSLATDDPRATGATLTDLRDFAAARLPSAAVPTSVTAIAALPLGANGKLDRSALSSVVRAFSDGMGVRVVETSREEGIARLWRDLLGVQVVGCEDDFFALGGDSLLVYHMLARVHGELGLVVDVQSFLARPTIASLLAEVPGASAARADVDADAYERELVAIERLSETEVAQLLSGHTSTGEPVQVAS
ncbi:MAG: amino acid adenylation domain-containing protein [Candidatus Binatia bacterium]